MGLSGRRIKQKIAADPRNLSWADDASKFGQSYLSKFGWDTSQGLGATGDGRTTHIKVHQKLDMMGIGAQHQKDPNGIAWKQNKDFENVLRRLNAVNGGAFDEAGAEAKEALDGAFISATESKADTTDRKASKKDKKERKDKKRKRTDSEIEEKVVRKRTKSEESLPVVAEGPVTKIVQKEKVLPRHRSHRARHIAAKNRAFNSAAAMSEILGIPSSSATPQLTPSGTLTPLTPDIDESNAAEKITVSSKSVADYFKERLLAKSGSSSSATPAEEDTPSRGGIGSRSAFALQTCATECEAPTVGIGMSKFGSLMSSTFMVAASSFGQSELDAMPDGSQPIKDKRKRKKDEDDSRKFEDKKNVKKKRQDEGDDMKSTADEDDERKRRKAEKRRLKEEKRRLAAGDNSNS